MTETISSYVKVYTKFTDAQAVFGWSRLAQLLDRCFAHTRRGCPEQLLDPIQNRGTIDGPEGAKSCGSFVRVADLIGHCMSRSLPRNAKIEHSTLNRKKGGETPPLQERAAERLCGDHVVGVDDEFFGGA